jgi:hypothetical protein
VTIDVRYLGNPSANPSSTQVAITVQDPPPPPPGGTGNEVPMRELTGDESVVWALYNDLLKRNPEPEGLAHWSNWLAQGRGQAPLVDELIHSLEYTALRVRAAYVDVLHREPEPDGYNFWVARVMSGAMTADDLKFMFYLSEEFYQQGGGTDAGFVKHLYTIMLGRAASPSENQFWVSTIASEGRAAVVRAVWFSLEAAKDRAAGYYRTFLGREPDAQGQTFWGQYMLATSENAVRVGMAGSPEYRQHAIVRYPQARTP